LLGFGVGRDRVFHLCAKVVVAHRRASESDDCELGGQEPLLGESIERGNKLAFGEVSGRAENDYGARIGSAFEPHAFS